MPVFKYLVKIYETETESVCAHARAYVYVYVWLAEKEKEIDWLVGLLLLTWCKPRKGYFMPRGLGISFIVHIYILCIVFP